MKKNKNVKGKQVGHTQDMSLIVQMISEVSLAIEQYKAENPDVDVEAALAEHKELLPVLGLLPSRELSGFVAYAKEQGTKMPFDEMEMGVLAAGRKDMQNGLTEILDSLKFNKPTCSECGENMDNRGRGKKNS